MFPVLGADGNEIRPRPSVIPILQTGGGNAVFVFVFVHVLNIETRHAIIIETGHALYVQQEKAPASIPFYAAAMLLFSPAGQ